MIADEPTGAFTQLVGTGEPLADIVAAASSQLRLEGDHVGVESDELGLELSLLAG